MTKTLKIVGIIVGGIVTLSLIIGYVISINLAQGSAPSGLKATQAIATTTEVGPQETVTLFSSSACSARVIGTVGVEITILFADPTNGDISSTTLSDVIGFPQAASTTVAYDSGIYGCGRVTAHSEASTTILVVETR